MYIIYMYIYIQTVHTCVHACSLSKVTNIFGSEDVVSVHSKMADKYCLFMIYYSSFSCCNVFFILSQAFYKLAESLIHSYNIFIPGIEVRNCYFYGKLYVHKYTFV